MSADRPFEVVTASMDPPDDEVAELAELLDDGERTRAARFSFDEPRRRFIVSRGRLRRTLQSLGAGDAAALRFVTGAHGKPTLVDGALRFNVSHSDDLWVCAVSRDREIGIDVERRRPDRPFDRLAARFFSPPEAEQVLALEGEERMAAFYRCWTRKEAWLKARGFGISIPLDSFQVTVAAGEEPRLVASAGEPGEERRWRFASLDLGGDYEGVVVFSDPPGGPEPPA